MSKLTSKEIILKFSNNIKFCKHSMPRQVPSQMPHYRPKWMKKFIHGLPCTRGADVAAAWQPLKSPLTDVFLNV